MTIKAEIFQQLKEAKGTLKGSTRPAQTVQLDKWELNGRMFMVTSNKLRANHELICPNYSDERLEELTTIN